MSNTSDPKSSADNSPPPETNGGPLSPTSGKFRAISLLARANARPDSLAQVVACKRLAKMPILFLAKRRQMRKITIENSEEPYTDDNATLIAASFNLLGSEYDAHTFDEYTQKLEEALTALQNMKRDDYESEHVTKVLNFLESLIHRPKEWISGAKLKLSELKFPETAMTFLHSYKQKGYLLRRTVFLNSMLLYNSMGNFTDHEFDKEGLIRKQAADAGFIEFACEILSDASYQESLKRRYEIENPEDVLTSTDFTNYQKILYICDSALTILYNMANLPELKIHFSECNATSVIAEYAKLSSDTVVILFPENSANKDSIARIKELQDIVIAIRVTSYLLLPLIMNEDEDDILDATTSDIVPLLLGMIQMHKSDQQRFHGFTFNELVDGLSKLMVRGRTHKYINQKLLDILLKILENTEQDDCLLECVSNALLNASFDEKVQKLLDSDRALEIIDKARNACQSQLVQKNCEAILWTLNRIPHRRVSTISNSSGLDGHIMISYNRSVTAMCLKLRDRLKALHYNVWLDVDNINGGVLESMAEAVENSSIVLICMNEQYKQSYYCRLEAEYATELRKPCVPCLMQPRFRPYGWLGIIKGAKIHVDFATFPFEEAFSLLIREIETIKRDGLSRTNGTNEKTQRPVIRSHGTGISSIERVNSLRESRQTQSSKSFLPSNNPIADWDIKAVKEWLERIGMTNLDRAFTNMDGKLLERLYQMKLVAADSYYKFLDKYFDRIKIARMSDVLKFDVELDTLFQ